MLWGSLVLLTLAVARTTRLVTADFIMLPFRRWVVNRWGEESKAAYWVHCSWCASIFFAFFAAVLWAVLLLPAAQWWVAAPAWFAMSYLTGLLSQLEER